MTPPSLVACVLALLFFLAGCLQLAYYIARVSVENFGSYLSGLLLAAWPLAVTAIVFALLDIRMCMSLRSKMRPEKHDEPEIPEAPLAARPPRPPKPTREEKPERISYFNLHPSQMPPLPNYDQPLVKEAAPEPEPASPFFSTPPPFMQNADAAPVPEAAPPVSPTCTTVPLNMPSQAEEAAPAVSPTCTTVPLDMAPQAEEAAPAVSPTCTTVPLDMAPQAEEAAPAAAPAEPDNRPPEQPAQPTTVEDRQEQATTPTATGALNYFKL